MFSSHHLLIPKTLKIGKIFTIFFRFYNPTISTEFEHCLLQNSEGKTLLAISEDKRNLIAYSINGERIDSGILLDEIYLNTWVSVGLSYIEQDNKTKLIFFFENEKTRCFDNGENYKLTNNIAYIGNSKDFNNPFGTFCDLRVYKKAVDFNGYMKIKKLTEDENNNREKHYNNINYNFDKNCFDMIFYKINNDIMKIIISNFVYFSKLDKGKNNNNSNFNSNLDKNEASENIEYFDNDNTEESFYYFIKLLNALMIKKDVRNSYIHNNLTFKIMEFINSESAEIKKDITKFLKIIS